MATSNCQCQCHWMLRCFTAAMVFTCVAAAPKPDPCANVTVARRAAPSRARLASHLSALLATASSQALRAPDASVCWESVLCSIHTAGLCGVGLGLTGP